MAIATPSSSTSAMGYMNAPPSCMKRTIVLNIWISTPCLTGKTCRTLERVATPAPRPGSQASWLLRRHVGPEGLVVTVLAPEHVAVDRRQHFIEQASCRPATQLAQLRALPR